MAISAGKPLKAWVVVEHPTHDDMLLAYELQLVEFEHLQGVGRLGNANAMLRTTRGPDHMSLEGVVLKCFEISKSAWPGTQTPERLDVQKLLQPAACTCAGFFTPHNCPVHGGRS